MTIGRAGLRDLLMDSLALWDVRADAAWDGAELAIRSAEGAWMAVWPAASEQSPIRWFLREPGGRIRPALSITGLLTSLRAASGASPTRLRLRIALDTTPATPAVVAPENGAPENGAPENGAPENGAPENGRTPVLVVTGALGSGKTTMIARMLTDPRYSRTAVVVNEFGAVGLDHLLVASSDETLVQLASGCLCCAVRGDLLDTLLDLERRRQAGEVAFDRVVVETSGLADPTPILHGLLTDAAVSAVFAVRGVATLIDAVHGQAALEELVEAQQQAALADRILFTKTDIAPVPDALSAGLARINPEAVRARVAYGAVDPDWLFAPCRLPQRPLDASRFSTAMHTPGIGSVMVEPAGALPAAALSLFLQALAEHAGHRLLRAKGLLEVAERPGRPALIHGIRHVFASPTWLDGWPGRERRSFLVLIGSSIPLRWPARLLAAITAEVDDETRRRNTDFTSRSNLQERPMPSSTVPSDHAVSRRALGRLTAGVAVALAAPAVLARAQPATLRIANIQPITGSSAAYGWRARDGAQLVVDEINAKGLPIGGTTYHIELALQDMANDPQQAVTLLRQAASDASVMAAIGPSNSVGFVPCVPAAGQLQLPMVGAGSGAPIKQWNPWAFRVNPVSSTAIPELLRKVHGKIGFKRLAVIYDQTQDGQAGDAQVCKTQAKALGYEVVAFEAFRGGDQDFSAQLATIRVARPDALFVAGATGDGVKVATQVRELGIQAPMMTGFGSFQDPVYWDGTHGVIKGCYTWLAQDLASPTPAVKNFMDSYQQRFKQEATSFATYGADAVSAIAAAATKAGSLSRAKLQEALATLDTTTPLGTHLTFKNPPDGDNNTPTVVAIEITGRGTYTAL